MFFRSAIVTLIVLNSVLPALSQSDSTVIPKKKRHELGFVLFQSMISTTLLSPFRPWNFVTNGLYWKVSKGKNAIRTAVSYQHTQWGNEGAGVLMTEGDFFSPFMSYGFDINELKAVETKFAYERLRNNQRKFSLYYLCEVSYAFNQIQNISIENQIVYKQNYHFLSYGSLLGFRYLPHPRVVLAFETGLRVTIAESFGGYPWMSGSDYSGIWLNLGQISAGLRF